MKINFLTMDIFQNFFNTACAFLMLILILILATHLIAQYRLTEPIMKKKNTHNIFIYVLVVSLFIMLGFEISP